MRKAGFTLAALFSLLMVPVAHAGNGREVHPDRQSLSDRDKRVLSQEVLDSLFGKLHRAQSPERARVLAGAIWKLWNRAGTPTGNILLVQAEKAMQAGQKRVAGAILSTIIDQYPDFAEAWNKRATLRFLTGDYQGSIADIKQVLKREPRHFGALSGLGLIYRRQGHRKLALKAFRRALAIHPHLPAAKRAVKALAGKVEQDI